MLWPTSLEFRNWIVEGRCRESGQWDVSNVSLVSIAKGFGDDNPSFFLGYESLKGKMNVKDGHHFFLLF